MQHANLTTDSASSLAFAGNQFIYFNHLFRL